jgi:hypothetical protein
MTHESNPPPTGRGPGYEVRDTNVQAVVIFLVGLSLLLLVSQVFLWGLLRGMSSAVPEPKAELTTPPMIPGLLDALHEKEDAVLAGKAGQSIPIDDAIRQLVEKGIPPTAAGLTEADVNSHAGIPASKTDATAKAKEPNQAKDAPK